MFGAGCFWQVEVEFRNTPGVTDVQVGYSGGDVESPTYEQVCTGQTGHAEVVEVTFDPDQVSYEQLLEKFFELHDPTQLDRQGPDVGTQYRSVIFAHSPDQELAAFAATQAEQAKRSAEVVTEVSPALPFWPAEDYHQQYLQKRGLATCRI
jgi:peptide-methionine (S)-S-oxide reductase